MILVKAVDNYQFAITLSKSSLYNKRNTSSLFKTRYETCAME